MISFSSRSDSSSLSQVHGSAATLVSLFPAKQSLSFLQMIPPVLLLLQNHIFNYVTLCLHDGAGACTQECRFTQMPVGDVESSRAVWLGGNCELQEQICSCAFSHWTISLTPVLLLIRRLLWLFSFCFAVCWLAFVLFCFSFPFETCYHCEWSKTCYMAPARFQKPDLPSGFPVSEIKGMFSYSFLWLRIHSHIPVWHL